MVVVGTDAHKYSHTFVATDLVVFQAREQVRMQLPVCLVGLELRHRTNAQPGPAGSSSFTVVVILARTRGCFCGAPRVPTRDLRYFSCWRPCGLGRRGFRRGTCGIFLAGGRVVWGAAGSDAGPAVSACARACAPRFLTELERSVSHRPACARACAPRFLTELERSVSHRPACARACAPRFSGKAAGLSPFRIRIARLKEATVDRQSRWSKPISDPDRSPQGGHRRPAKPLV